MPSIPLIPQGSSINDTPLLMAVAVPKGTGFEAFTYDPFSEQIEFPNCPADEVDPQYWYFVSVPVGRVLPLQNYKYQWRILATCCVVGQQRVILASPDMREYVTEREA